MTDPNRALRNLHIKLTSPAPFGFCYDDQGRKQVEPEENGVLTGIIRTIKTEHIGNRAIAGALNKLGHMHRERKWTENDIAKIRREVKKGRLVLL